MRISDWSSDVCSSDLIGIARLDRVEQRLVRQVGIALGGLEPRIEPVSRDARAVTMAELAEHLGKLVRIFHLAERRQIECGDRLLLELPDASSEERRAGKEGVRTVRTRWSPYHKKKKQKTETDATHRNNTR